MLKFIKMRTLVTGGAGFIGSHIVDKLIALGHEVLVIDNLRSGKKDNINPKAQFNEVDVCNLSQLDGSIGIYLPEVIFHLAAQNEVPYSMDHPYEDNQINILGMMNLMEVAKKNLVKKVVYSNTGGAYYGEVPEADLPITENHPVYKPTSFYGVSKHAAELYLKLYGSLYNISWVSLRYSNVYGPRQDGNKEAGVVAIFTEKLLKKEIPTINGDGHHTRDYVFVEDVVEANMKALEFGGSDYFNIATGVGVENNDVFYAIETELKTGLQPEFGPDRPGDARHVTLDPGKAERTLGFKAQTDFKTGVKKTVEYYLSKKGRGLS
jgi:UDP-glucose 4-epimerase